MAKKDKEYKPYQRPLDSTISSIASKLEKTAGGRESARILREWYAYTLHLEDTLTAIKDSLDKSSVEFSE